MPEPRRAQERRLGGVSAPPTPDAPAETQLNVKIPTALRERALNAFYGTDVAVVWKKFVEQALDEFTSELENQRNGGKPFPPRPADSTKLPPGRRAGVSPRRVT
ncbi:hypothetical protein [Actinoplanes sp. NPDC051851]|uniref:hypothetical protein n=1 Tax=Actinoplanes sp. NPDC051851 TaxID=3154753 RepID=UPI003440DC5F